MRGKIDMYGLVALLVFVFVVIGIHELSAQEEAIVVEWGEEVSCPDLGFNARILRQHAEENCGQPEQEDFRYDWNSANLRQDVRDISPKVLRFPGGTPSNFWNWYNETRQVIGEDGNLHEIDVCEASFVGRTFSSSIGCEGDNLDITAERYSEIVTNTTVTVESYLNAIQYFRDQGMDVGELFVLNMIDPFYYLGSPHLEFITQGASPEVVKDTLRNNIVNKVEKQLDKILLEKCGSCESVDDEVSFELGNEFHLLRYGKYYPRMECFDMIDDSLCFNCFPDINFYADVCQDIIPLIRERFTNAKISVCASRNILQEPWNDVIIDRFAQDDELAIDAVVYHFYPKTFKKDSLNYARCVGNGNNYNSDKSLHYVQWHTDRLTFQKNLTAFDDTDLEMWITEFNSYDYSEKCNEAHPGWNEDDFVYDSANWLHTLNIFTIMDRFLTYRTDMYDPWTGNAQGLNIPKIAMHLFYGAEREAALNEDREMTAQGLGKSMLIDLVNNATSMQRLLVAPEENIDFDVEGNWTTSVGEEGMLPLHHDLEFSDQTGTVTNMNTLDSYGWMFKNEEGDNKALVINLRNEPIVLNVDGMKSFTGDTRFTIHHVAPSDLTTKLEGGWNSSLIETIEGETGDSSIEIPAYSIVVLEDIPVLLPNSLSEYHSSLMRVYPNPTTGELNIRLAESRGDQSVLTIYDLSGRGIERLTFSGQSTRIQLDHLPLGSYFVRVTNESIDEKIRVILTR